MPARLLTPVTRALGMASSMAGGTVRAGSVIAAGVRESARTCSVPGVNSVRASSRHAALARTQLGEAEDRYSRAFRVSFAFAFWIASTSSSLFIDERPGMSSFFATSSRCAFDAFASTPPFVVVPPGPPCSAPSSDGPFSSFGSQWSPTFS